MPSNAQAETEIRQVVQTLNDAAKRKDLEGVKDCYVKDAIAFDLVPPLVTRGAEAYANNWLVAYEMFEGPMQIDVRDMVIHASDDVAFLYMLEHFGGMGKDGKQLGLWIRITSGLRRINGSWKIVHEHGSVPIDMKSDRPLLNEQP